MAFKPPLPAPTAGTQQPSPYGTYNPGRGYSSKKNPRPQVSPVYHGRSGHGFYEGRPELGVDADAYDRMKIRPTTVPRGGGSPLIGQAAAIAIKEYYNYRKGGGRAGVEERFNRGGIESARMWDVQRKYNANQRGHDQEDFYPDDGAKDDDDANDDEVLPESSWQTRPFTAEEHDLYSGDEWYQNRSEPPL